MSSATSSITENFLASLKRLDIYRTVPKDLTEQTVAGATISVISAALIFILFMSEFITYMTVQTKHEMFIEHPLTKQAQAPLARFFRMGGLAGHMYEEESSMMKINFNITLPRMACAITNIGVQDVMGTAIDVQQKIHKYRTDNTGRLKFNPISGVPLSGDYGLPKEQMDEGCMIDGHIKVKKVPGNFHFSSNAHPDILSLFFAHGMGGGHGLNDGGKGIGGSLNTTHIINDLWFGETKALLTHVTGLATAFAPLNGGTKISTATEVSNGNEKSYEYFIKVIPSEVQTLYGEHIESYQYVSNSNEILGRFQMPTIFFRYDIEPVTVRFKLTSPSFSQFLISCSAIIGGMVAVLGLVNMAVKSSLRTFKPASVGAAMPH